MARAFFCFIILILVAGACTQRVICPAYQSAFIYDKEALRKKFSYFQEDSTPKVYAASKTKYLIAEPVSYRKKIRSMQTVEMKPVYVVLPDSLNPDKQGEEGEMGEDGVVPGAELDMAARSVIDSIYIVDVPQDTTATEEDSVYMISKDKEVRVLKYDFPDSLVYDSASGKYIAETPRYYVTEVKFNVEQDNYMWYLRNYLVLPDVRLAKQQQNQKAEEAKKEGGFFKRLFGKKKKKKDESDTTELQAPPKEEFDYIDEDEQLKAPAQQEEVKEKKGLFRRKKGEATKTEFDVETSATEIKPAKKKKQKKSKKKDEPAPTEEKEAKDEDDDDGF